MIIMYKMLALLASCMLWKTSSAQSADWLWSTAQHCPLLEKQVSAPTWLGAQL